MPSHRILSALVAFTLVTSGIGCVYPELSTPLRKAPNAPSFEPGPPNDRHYLEIDGGKIPQRTRDGRSWTESHLPDPYLKILVNGVELIKTDPVSKTLTPKWPDAPKGNFLLKSGDELRFELWDSNALVDHPIGVKTITANDELFSAGEQDIEFDDGLELQMHLEPARPIWGYGFRYELKNEAAGISKVIAASPASRAGMRSGDKVLKLSGRDITTLTSDDVSTLMARTPLSGLTMTLEHDDGSTLNVNLKEGPVYALWIDYGDPAKPPSE